MKEMIATCLTYREYLTSLVRGLPADKWDTIPAGFNINIRWQVAHIISTQMLLTYGLAGSDIPVISPEFVESTRKATSPANMQDASLYGEDRLLKLLVELPGLLQKDLDTLSKKEFKAYTTSTGFVIPDLATGLSYSNIHDGTHLGNIMALLKLI